MSNFSEIFSAEAINTRKRIISRLFLQSCDGDLDRGLVGEFRRAIALMPKTGLIIDIRANPGGNPDIVKLVLDLVSDKNILNFMIPTNLRATNFINKFFSLVQ